MSGRRAKRPLVNRELFAQVGTDSSALTVLAAAAHRCREPGDYQGVVTRGDEEVASFRLRVDESSPAMQVDVDLFALASGRPQPKPDPDCDCQGSGESAAGFVVNPSGYAVFHVSRGAGGFQVRLGRARDEREVAEFDSARLEGEDLFLLTLIRPGTYSMRNAITGAKGEIVVPYPEPPKGRYAAPAPIEIASGEKSFRPARAKVQVGQGVVWRFKGQGRVQLELVKPQDSPEGRRAKAA
jgi:hypothetical protein